jgi:hypothetical protein
MELENNTSISPPPQYAKKGWCAAMTLRQYLVCRERRKVAQHRCRAVLRNVWPAGCTWCWHEVHEWDVKNINTYKYPHVEAVSSIKLKMYAKVLIVLITLLTFLITRHGTHKVHRITYFYCYPGRCFEIVWNFAAQTISDERVMLKSCLLVCLPSKLHIGFPWISVLRV